MLTVACTALLIDWLFNNGAIANKCNAIVELYGN